MFSGVLVACSRRLSRYTFAASCASWRPQVSTLLV
jgi:hypothetical protein